jgi:hypothetical protein
VALGVLVHLSALRGRAPGDPVADRTPKPGWIARGRVVVERMRITRKATREWASGSQPTAGGERSDAGREVVPTGADSNEVLAADLRRLNADRRSRGLAPLGRDAVAKRYGVGSGRADTVRNLADQPPVPALSRPHLVRDDDDQERPA